MPAPDSPSILSAEAIQTGAADQLAALLEYLFADQADGPAAVFANLFWSQWRRHCGLHDAAADALEPLRGALARDSAWAVDARHPAWAVFALAQQRAIGFQPELGRAGDKLLGELQQWAAAAGRDGWAVAAAAGAAQWEQEQARIGRLEQRLINAERGQLRARRAQQQAAGVLNQAMAGQQLPPAVTEFLQGEWYQELQWCLLQFGDNTPEWRQRSALTYKLVESLQDPGDDASQRQQLYQAIPEVGPELRAMLAARSHNQELLERQLAEIEHQHLLLLRGRTPNYVDFELIANRNPWLPPNTRISAELLARVNDITPAQWFLYRAEQPDQRIKLALKMEDTGQLLFVNRLGIKAVQPSFEEFAYLLSSGGAAALPGPQFAEQLLRQLLRQLVQRYEEQQRAASQAAAERERAQAEAEARAAAEARHRAEAKAKAIAEAQALAAAQARAAAEAEERAREQEQARRRAVLQQQDENREQRQRAARQSAALLSVGAWVELHDELGQTQRLKVAVKLPSSGKLIFVDNDGIRRAELTQESFAAGLLDGSARVLDAGTRFEDALAEVVNNLRRDRAGKKD